MKWFKAVLVFIVVGIATQGVFSQCCCSGTDITMTDGAGVPLRARDVKISVVRREMNEGSIRFKKDEDQAKFHFRMGCGVGKETLLIEYQGERMRIRFMLLGEFGRPKADFVFAKGDHVAELVEKQHYEEVTKVALRRATTEEMKEIEPPATDASSDQTANSL